MKLVDATQYSLIEARIVYGSMAIVEDGEAPRWQFAYNNYQHDPRPDILLLGAYKHPTTGNNLVGGINIHYLSDDQRNNLAKILPQIMQASDLKTRYWVGRKLLPDVFTNFYRTYDSKFIRGVRKDVMYPKFGFMKTAQKWLTKKLGSIFKSKEQRKKEIEPQYPSDLESMDDKLDQIVLQLQKQQAEPEDTPEMQAARANFKDLMRHRTLRDIEKREDEPMVQAQTDLEKQQQRPKREDPRQAEADFNKDREENKEELEDPDNELDLGEAISYYSPRLRRYIIEPHKISESKGWLETELLQMRGKIVQTAQQIYNEWDQDDNDLYGGGGICDEICNAIGDVLDAHDINWTEGGHEGDDHAYAIAYTDDESFAVDIPAYVYETGGGYSWQKIHDIQILPNDVNIIEVQRPDWIDPLEESSPYDKLDDTDQFGTIAISPIRLGPYTIGGETDTTMNIDQEYENDLTISYNNLTVPVHRAAVLNDRHSTHDAITELIQLIKNEYPDVWKRHYGSYDRRFHYLEILHFALTDLIEEVYPELFSNTYAESV